MSPKAERYLDPVVSSRPPLPVGSSCFYRPFIILHLFGVSKHKARERLSRASVLFSEFGPGHKRSLATSSESEGRRSKASTGLVGEIQQRKPMEPGAVNSHPRLLVGEEIVPSARAPPAVGACRPPSGTHQSTPWIARSVSRSCRGRASRPVSPGQHTRQQQSRRFHYRGPAGTWRARFQIAVSSWFRSRLPGIEASFRYRRAF